MIFPQRLDRPYEIRAPDQERREAECKYRLAQAGDEVLPEGRFRTGIGRTKEYGEHEDETEETRGTHHDAENERESDRQFTIGHEKRNGRGVREDKPTQNGRHKRVGSSLEEFV